MMLTREQFNDAMINYVDCDDEYDKQIRAHESEMRADLEAVTKERNKLESYFARIASLRIDETGTACFSNATDGRGIDFKRVTEQARQTCEQLAQSQARVQEMEAALQDWWAGKQSGKYGHVDPHERKLYAALTPTPDAGQETK